MSSSAFATMAVFSADNPAKSRTVFNVDPNVAAKQTAFRECIRSSLSSDEGGEGDDEEQEEEEEEEEDAFRLSRTPSLHF